MWTAFWTLYTSSGVYSFCLISEKNSVLLMRQSWALIGDLPAGTAVYKNNVGACPSNRDKPTPMTIKPVFWQCNFHEDEDNDKHKCWSLYRNCVMVNLYRLSMYVLATNHFTIYFPAPQNFAVPFLSQPGQINVNVNIQILKRKHVLMSSGMLFRVVSYKLTDRIFCRDVD